MLLWGCDASTIAIAMGLLFGVYRLFAAGALFQIAIGMPAFIVGLATVYVPNVTGVGVHTLPPIIGGVVIARRGLPGRPAIAAAAGYARPDGRQLPVRARRGERQLLTRRLPAAGALLSQPAPVLALSPDGGGDRPLC